MLKGLKDPLKRMGFLYSIKKGTLIAGFKE